MNIIKAAKSKEPLKALGPILKSELEPGQNFMFFDITDEKNMIISYPETNLIKENHDLQIKVKYWKSEAERLNKKIKENGK